MIWKLLLWFLSYHSLSALSSMVLLSGMVSWPDNMDTTKWYYLAVQEATNSHEYSRKDNGYEYWTELKKVRDWAALEK